jgi:hypothetical protein
MGSFNTSCALTHEIIDGGTEVVALMLTKKPYDTRMPVHSWDIYAPVPILFEGVYDCYGALENLKLFQSKEVLSEDALKAAEHALFTDLQTMMTSDKDPIYDGPPASNLEELIMDRNVSFIRKDTSIMILQTILDMAAKETPPETQKTKDEMIQMYLDQFKFANLEDAREHVKKKEAEYQKVSVSFMMFRKDAFMKLLNEYGMEKEVDEDNIDDENYAVRIQMMRNQDLSTYQSEDLTEMVDYVNKSASYSGANRPEYTLEHAIKGSAKKAGQVREDLIVLKKMYAVDISLLNDYFTLLGMTYQPSMYVSESIREYGHTEAFAMQQTLLESVKLKTTMKS